MPSGSISPAPALQGAASSTTPTMPKTMPPRSRPLGTAPGSVSQMSSRIQIGTSADTTAATPDGTVRMPYISRP